MKVRIIMTGMAPVALPPGPRPIPTAGVPATIGGLDVAAHGIVPMEQRNRNTCGYFWCGLSHMWQPRRGFLTDAFYRHKGFTHWRPEPAAGGASPVLSQ